MQLKTRAVVPEIDWARRIGLSSQFALAILTFSIVLVQEPRSRFQVLICFSVCCYDCVISSLFSCTGTSKARPCSGEKQPWKFMR